MMRGAVSRVPVLVRTSLAMREVVKLVQKNHEWNATECVIGDHVLHFAAAMNKLQKTQASL